MTIDDAISLIGGQRGERHRFEKAFAAFFIIVWSLAPNDEKLQRSALTTFAFLVILTKFRKNGRPLKRRIRDLDDLKKRLDEAWVSDIYREYLRPYGGISKIALNRNYLTISRLLTKFILKRHIEYDIVHCAHFCAVNGHKHWKKYTKLMISRNAFERSGQFYSRKPDQRRANETISEKTLEAKITACDESMLLSFALNVASNGSVHAMIGRKRDINYLFDSHYFEAEIMQALRCASALKAFLIQKLDAAFVRKQHDFQLGAPLDHGCIDWLRNHSDYEKLNRSSALSA